MHGRELEPGLSLNVYLSNPERKKERTDADANSREVYVAGLSKFVTKQDLEKLFRTVSSPVVRPLLLLTKMSVWSCERHTDGFRCRQPLKGLCLC
jgi:hypothetical protein